MLLPERRRAEKPGQMVPEDVELEVVAAPEFVSRGGIKLANALDKLALDVAGAHALDVGASTERAFCRSITVTRGSERRPQSSSP